MGQCCCSCLFGGPSYEKVDAVEGRKSRSTGIELSGVNEEIPSSRRPRRTNSLPEIEESDGKVTGSNKNRARRKYSGSSKPPTLAPPPEDIERLKATLKEKLRVFFLIHNPSQANPKSLAHIVAFYTSFDTVKTLNKRLRDKYGCDLSSVDANASNGNRKGPSHYRPPSPPSSSRTATTTTTKQPTNDEQKSYSYNNYGDNASSSTGGTAENDGSTGGGGGGGGVGDSALQRAAMFEQTWHSDIPEHTTTLKTRPNSPGLRSLDALTSALATARVTFVASGEVDGQVKAYLYTSGMTKEDIVLVELIADRNTESGETREYRLLCKFVNKAALDIALDRIATALNAIDAIHKKKD